MKKFLSFILLQSLLIFIPLFAQAELLIYKGTAKFKITGEGIAKQVALKTTLVFDQQTTQAVIIVYGTVNRFKFYTTQNVTNLTIVQTTGKAGKSYTALTLQRTQCDRDAGEQSERVLGQGADAVLKINTSLTTVFPKILSVVDTTVSFSEADVAVIVQENVTVTFNSAETIRSNSTGETVDDAAGRLTSQLQSLGYTHTAGKGQSETLMDQVRAAAQLQ